MIIMNKRWFFYPFNQFMSFWINFCMATCTTIFDKAVKSTICRIFGFSNTSKNRRLCKDSSSLTLTAFFNFTLSPYISSFFFRKIFVLAPYLLPLHLFTKIIFCWKNICSPLLKQLKFYFGTI